MKGKVAIITGASGGLGRILASELCRFGASVIVHYLTNKKMAEDLVGKINERGGEAISIMADVTNEKDVLSMIQMTMSTFGKIDILINNSGISLDAISWKLGYEEWKKVLNVNLNGAFLCSKAVLPDMRRRKWGRIINISSVVAQIGVPGTSGYAASKAGLFGLTRTLAREVINKGITVNCLSLGYFNTGLIDTLDPSSQQSLIEQIPAGRLGKPEEIAFAVRYLCDDLAGYVTGQVLNINGGLYM